MANNNEISSRDKTIETLKSVALTLLFLIVGWLYTAQQKTEERLFQMSATAFTDQKASQLEDRISRSIDVRLSDLSNRLDLLLKLVQANQDNKR